MMHAGRKAASWRNARRFLLFYGVWLVISQARVEFAAIGLAVAGAAVGLNHALWATGGSRVRLFGLLAFLPGFLWRALKGGVDVAWRVFHPAMPLRPGFLDYRCRDGDEIRRVLFCDLISLVPGTLAAGLDGRQAAIHVLSVEPETRSGIAREEAGLNRVLAPEPPSAPEGGGR